MNAQQFIQSIHFQFKWTFFHPSTVYCCDSLTRKNSADLLSTSIIILNIHFNTNTWRQSRMMLLMFTLYARLSQKVESFILKVIFNYTIGMREILMITMKSFTSTYSMIHNINAELEWHCDSNPSEWWLLQFIETRTVSECNNSFWTSWNTIFSSLEEPISLMLGEFSFAWTRNQI